MTSQATSKRSYLKVRMSYGSGPTNEDFVAGWTEDVGTYIATDMEVDGLHNSGSLDVSPITVEVLAGNTFFDALARGVPFPPIFLYVTEVLTALGPSGSDSEEILHAIGDYKLMQVNRNPDRRQGFVRLEFWHQKKLLTRNRLGMASNPTCGWTLGDKSCQATVTPETATIAAIDRKKITLTDPADAAAVTDRPAGDFPYWHRGFMEIDGLRISIRDWTDDSYDFQMEQDPPATWLGQAVTLTPGCGKTPADCVAKFDNIRHFGGFGIKIPAYNPGLELS